MICINGTFFTSDGRVTDEDRLKKEILSWISPYVFAGIPKKLTNLLDTMRVLAYSECLPTYQDRIFLANGTYYLSGEFEETKDFCTNRLPVAYNPDAPEPVQWLKFVNQLLHEDDIPTLQEYMGYCLIPSNKGQQMLFLVGKGGEGKSRVGLVMRALLGYNIVEFMESEGYFRFKSDTEISPTDFYAIYTLWCSENSEKPLAPRSFSSYIIQQEKDYNLEYSNNVMDQGKRRVRGFWGIEPLVNFFRKDL